MERGTRKRKFAESENSSRFPLNDLNQDVLERVLSKLPTSSFLQLTPVCKKWKSIADSTTFKLACSQVPARDPWFLMVDSSQPHAQNRPIIFDSSEDNWKKLNHHFSFEGSFSNFIPVSSSGGLLCFHNPNGEFIINNPVTGSFRHLAGKPVPQQPVQAIAMLSEAKSRSFKLVSVSGEELSKLKFRQYSSITDQWGAEIDLVRKIDSPVESETNEYFLSKCGNVVSTDIQRSPCKQFSSLLTVDKNGEEILHFLSSSGTVVCCNLTNRLFFEYPRLLPVSYEYSIDLVECGGEIYVVLLSEFLESASIRVWRWDEGNRSWRQVAAMRPAMSHKFYGKKVDINCSGAGEKILICLNSVEICSYVLCDLVGNEWVELPHCFGDREFVCAFSFEPRIEVSV